MPLVHLLALALLFNLCLSVFSQSTQTCTRDFLPDPSGNTKKSARIPTDTYAQSPPAVIMEWDCEVLYVTPGALARFVWPTDFSVNPGETSLTVFAGKISDTQNGSRRNITRDVHCSWSNHKPRNSIRPRCGECR
ncbi:hypothetical protein O181_072566 [Austropuccinia psidii MF-1]|uniref:Uncharacterized protein n=1 Tax=Austropuccinia psidii MF-1 TaxID=1389203 RepID=A0A9Q3F9G5_9BASI|nr:hypothetical protein [Austropuccinia psidii MF-1]